MRFVFYVPILLFVLILIGAGMGLFSSSEPVRMEPVPLPEFQAPLLSDSSTRLSKTSPLFGKGYVLLNVFGSWCVTCRIEHPFLLEIKKEGVLPIYGLNWKDSPQKVNEWLEKLGNPYEVVALDESGAAIIALGVTGAPETLLISPEHEIIARHRGVLTESVLKEVFLPLVPGKDKQNEK